MVKTRFLLSMVAVAAAVLIIDQWTKAMLAPNGHFLNSEAAFSWLVPQPFMLVVSVAVLAALLLAMGYHFHQTALGIALAAMTGAGLSNVLDRLRVGVVIDILYVGSLSLNIADIGILAGAAVVLFVVITSACCNRAATGLHQKT